MPFSGDTFTKLYSWLTDPQRNEKIFNSRLDDEFGGVATGLTTVSTDLSTAESAITTAQGNITTIQGNITTIQGNITTIQGDITTIQGNITTIQSNITALQAEKSKFRAYKSADQTGIADLTATQLTFNTEGFDVGSHFASNAWTPPAGKVLLTVCLLIQGTTSIGNPCTALIYKNGSVIAQSRGVADVYTYAGTFVSVIDAANGSDVYTAYALLDVNSGTATAVAGPHITYFEGALLQ